MKKKKENRGGARPGAGRKTGKEDEHKKSITLRMYPTDKARIIEKYGSLQKWADTHTPKTQN